MKRTFFCWLILSLFLSGCGRKEPIVIPKPTDMPDMEELVEVLEPENVEEEKQFSDAIAVPCITRGTFVREDLDITGDGSGDKVEVICYGNSEDDAGYAKGWDIIINNELVYDLYSSEYIQPEIAFYMLDEKCVYMAIKEYAPGNSDLKAFKLYEYKNDKIKPICDFYEHVAGGPYEADYYVDIIQARAKEIILHCRGQFGNPNYPEWHMIYNYDEEWEAENVEMLPIKVIQKE